MEQLKRLLQSALTGVPALIAEEVNLDKLYRISKAHDLANVAAVGLKNSGYAVPESFRREEFLAVYRCEQLTYELEQVKKVLKEASIPFVLLKGSVLRPFYPEPSLRTSADIDILIREQDMGRVFAYLTERLSYEGQKDGNGHHRSMKTPGGMTLEVHRSLNKEYPQLNDVWEHVIPLDGSQYQMDELYFFTFHIVHMAVHFKLGGCGIRPLMDLWIMRNKMGMDFDYQRLREFGLEKFAKAAVTLSEIWFDQADETVPEYTKITKAMESYILYGGTFGNLENRVSMNRSDQSGVSYVWNRLFPSYQMMKQQYPMVEKAPVLLPLYWILRFMTVLWEGRGDKMLRELKYNRQLSQRKYNPAEFLCKELGL